MHTMLDTIKELEELIQHYRKLWELELCQSTEIEQFGYNEFLGGKAEGLEEALKILHQNSTHN